MKRFLGIPAPDDEETRELWKKYRIKLDNGTIAAMKKELDRMTLKAKWDLSDRHIFPEVYEQEGEA